MTAGGDGRLRGRGRRRGGDRSVTVGPGRYRRAGLRWSSPTRPRPRTSSRPPPSRGAGSPCPGSARTRCRATWPSSTSSRGWAPASERGAGIEVAGTAALGRHRRRPGRPVRHRPDAGRGRRASPTRPPASAGVGFIRGKETDRIAALVTELRRCGVDATEADDGFVVRPGVAALHGARVATYDDHRMAMSFALLGLRVAGHRDRRSRRAWPRRSPATGRRWAASVAAG